MQSGRRGLYCLVGSERIASVVNGKISNKAKTTGQSDEVVLNSKSQLMCVLSCIASIVNLTFFTACYFIQQDTVRNHSESILLTLVILFCVNVAYVSYTLIAKMKSTSIFIAALVSFSMILSIILIVMIPLAMLQVFFSTLR